MNLLNRKCTVTLRGKIIRDYLNGNADQVLAVSTDDGTVINVYPSSVELEPVEVEAGGVYIDEYGDRYFGLSFGKVIDPSGREYYPQDVEGLAPLVVNQ